jgi:OPA family glycerol-3-phosphate transporter-like MFS transporter
MMRNSPKDAGFGDLDTGDDSAPDDGAPPALSYILRKVFASRATWTIAVISMMVGMVRRSTIDSWYPKYFKELYLPGAQSVASFIPYQTAVWGIALCGIAGGFAFGIASDRVFGGRRAPVIAVGFGGMIGLLLLFGLLDHWALGPWPAAICLSLLSFFVNGAHGMIGGAASMDFGGRKAAATAAGLFDGMQYLASSLVGIGMGWMLDHWGWRFWQFVPVPFALAGALLAVSLWNVVPGRRAGH